MHPADAGPVHLALALGGQDLFFYQLVFQINFAIINSLAGKKLQAILNCLCNATAICALKVVLTHKLEFKARVPSDRHHARR